MIQDLIEREEWQTRKREKKYVSTEALIP